MCDIWISSNMGLSHGWMVLWIVSHGDEIWDGSTDIHLMEVQTSIWWKYRHPSDGSTDIHLIEVRTSIWWKYRHPSDRSTDIHLMEVRTSIWSKYRHPPDGSTDIHLMEVQTSTWWNYRHPSSRTPWSAFNVKYRSETISHSPGFVIFQNSFSLLLNLNVRVFRARKCIWHPFSWYMGLDGTLTSHIELVRYGLPECHLNPYRTRMDASTQFSQEWARRKVIVKHSIKSKLNQMDAICISDGTDIYLMEVHKPIWGVSALTCWYTYVCLTSLWKYTGSITSGYEWAWWALQISGLAMHIYHNTTNDPSSWFTLKHDEM